MRVSLTVARQSEVPSPWICRMTCSRPFGTISAARITNELTTTSLFRKPEVTVLRPRLIPRHLHHVLCITADLASALDVLISGRHVQPSAREQGVPLPSSATPSRLNRRQAVLDMNFKFVCTHNPRIFLSFIVDSCNPKKLNSTLKLIDSLHSCPYS
jgi:hypothetical protein